MRDTIFLSLARKVVYISSIAVFGTIASIVMYATFAAFSGPSSGPSAANHSRGLLYDYMFGAATNSGAVQQGSGWTDVPSSGTSALAGTVNEKLNFVVSKLLTGISTAALDGVYDSTAVAANKNGNALNMLKYIQQGIDSAGAAGGAGTPATNGVVAPVNANNLNYIIFKPTHKTYPVTVMANASSADAECMDPANKPDEAVSTGFMVRPPYAMTQGYAEYFRQWILSAQVNTFLKKTTYEWRVGVETYPSNLGIISYLCSAGWDCSFQRSYKIRRFSTRRSAILVIIILLWVQRHRSTRLMLLVEVLMVGRKIIISSILALWIISANSGLFRTAQYRVWLYPTGWTFGFFSFPVKTNLVQGICQWAAISEGSSVADFEIGTDAVSSNINNNGTCNQAYTRIQNFKWTMLVSCNSLSRLMCVYFK